METYLLCSHGCICHYTVCIFLSFFNIIVYFTELLIMSREKHKLGRLEMNPISATNETPTCAVPLHAPQTSSLWQGVGKVSSTGEVGC